MTLPRPRRRRRLVRRRTGLLAGALVIAGAGGACAGAEPTADPEESSTPSATAEPNEGPSRPGAPTEPVASLRVDEGLPPIAHPGGAPRPIGDASAVVTAQVRPASPGEVVVLQRRQGDGWTTVSRAEQNASGIAIFADLETAPTPGTSYRAVVPQSATSPPAEASVWTPIFSDEFAGTSLDPSKWTHRQLGFYNPGSRDCSKTDPSAASASGGTLQLHVRIDPRRTGEPCVTREYGTHDYYLNGHVATEGLFDFKYGVAAARVKFQRERGQHGAFWLQRQVPAVIAGDPTSSGAEIDIAEFFGEGYQDGGLASFIYYRNAQDEDEKVGGLLPRATSELPPGDSWWRNFHVFSVEWTPEEYIFRVDGRETFRTDEVVSGVEQFLVLSLQSSDWELAKLDRSALPTTMEVDWVRVWQRAAS
jgi:beta-glucanase (GH16 family)